jgi:hypothetical protein
LPRAETLPPHPYLCRIDRTAISTEECSRLVLQDYGSINLFRSRDYTFTL